MSYRVSSLFKQNTLQHNIKTKLKKKKTSLKIWIIVLEKM